MGKTYCQKVVKKFDDDGSKTLNLDEFKSVVGHLMGAQEKYDDAKVEAEFTRADKNASGTIDAAEPAACSASSVTTSARSTWRTSSRSTTTTAPRLSR